MASLSNLSNKREYMIFPLGVEKICLRNILHCIVTKMVLTKVYKKRRESEQFTLLAFFPLLIWLQNKFIQFIPVLLPHRQVLVKHSSKLSIVIFRHDVS